MKSINPTFEDADFNKLKKLKKAKNKGSWREFILTLLEEK